MSEPIPAALTEDAETRTRRGAGAHRGAGTPHAPTRLRGGGGRGEKGKSSKQGDGPPRGGVHLGGDRAARGQVTSSRRKGPRGPGSGRAGGRGQRSAQTPTPTQTCTPTPDPTLAVDQPLGL